MKKLHQQKGFTLVELAIVLTIIGLLIGGILKGQQLMTNARVTATMAQIQAIESATTTFRDTYNAIPGDMPAADTRIPNCANCGFAAAAVATAGDGVVGAPAWTVVTPQAAANVGAATTATQAQETILFWAELSQAGLLSGITSDGITNTNAPTFGSSLPSARLGGGWVVGNSNGAQTRNASAAVTGNTTLSMAGLVLMLTPNATTAAPTGTGLGILTPTIAAQIDRKMDDGVPTSGFSQAYGLLTSCFANVAAGNPGTYLESVTAKDCGMVFRIQG
jgi:prepilin-type N-terminal cleavage/methylation domain-containing protein